MGSYVHYEEQSIPGLIVRDAHGDDIIPLAANLRAEDLAEVVAASGLTAIQAIGHGYVHSRPAITIEYNGKPAAMFGVVPSEQVEKFGSIWLLGTNDLHLFSTKFLRQSKRWLDIVTQGYDIVGNVVDERNTDHIKWLRWLGFKSIKKWPHYGPLGLPFYEFVKIVETPSSV